MKLFIQTLLASTLLACASIGSAADLHVKVEGVKSSNGKLTVALYSSADIYLKTPTHRASAAATEGVTLVVFKDIAPGDYALSGYHDENENDKIDRESMGIPTEPYGFGNGASGAMGPPPFEKARVSVPASGATTTLTVKRE